MEGLRNLLKFRQLACEEPELNLLPKREDSRATGWGDLGGQP